MPGLMDRRGNQETPIYNIWIFSFDDEVSYLHPPMDKYLTPELDYLKFAQLLTKIAYSYLASVERVENFTLDRVPVIHNTAMYWTKFATEKLPDEVCDYTCFSFVGGSPMPFEHDDYLHQIGHGPILVGDAKFYVVYIRLFATLGAPVYMVVANYRI